MAKPDVRLETCESLGIGSLLRVHEIITSCATDDPQCLLDRKLDADTLTALGYDAEGMHRLGSTDDALEALGYPMTSEPEPEPEPPPPPDDPPDEPQAKTVDLDPRALIAEGHKFSELKRLGLTVHRCKLAGVSARELASASFPLADLVEDFTPVELKGLGFTPREMGRFFDGSQLRHAGYTAVEMRVANYSPRDLLNFGYNENRVIAAGYSISDLTRAGLAIRTSDKKRFQQY